MREQMTVTGLIILVAGLTLFWGTVAAMIRAHRRNQRSSEELSQ